MFISGDVGADAGPATLGAFGLQRFHRGRPMVESERSAHVAERQ